MKDLLDDLHAKAAALPAVKPERPTRPEEPPVEPALIDISTINPADLRIVGRCCRCGQVQYSFENKTVNLCCECAALEVIRDPQKTYLEEVWAQAVNMARYSSAEQLVWRLGIERGQAIKFRWKMLGYDGQDDSRKSYDLAIAEMRKRHESGK